jgi:hypothetical protein
VTQKPNYRLGTSVFHWVYSKTSPYQHQTFKVAKDIYIYLKISDNGYLLHGPQVYKLHYITTIKIFVLHKFNILYIKLLNVYEFVNINFNEICAFFEHESNLLVMGKQ